MSFTSVLPLDAVFTKTETVSEHQIPALPADCSAIKIELRADSPAHKTAVFRCSVRQEGRDEVTAVPVRVAPPCAVSLETFCSILPGIPVQLRVERLPEDPVDECADPVHVSSVTVSAVKPLTDPVTVENTPGYNSWPMIASDGKELVCLYCRGLGHTIGDGDRDVFARRSFDSGRTWTDEIPVSAQPEFGEVPVGKGNDLNGNILFWVRCCGPVWPARYHALYRVTDGKFEEIARVHLNPEPMQITDIFTVPGVGLMSLWFATDYQKTGAWGVVTSSDNGLSWVQRTIGADLPLADLPTEPSAVYLGDGRILAIARTENGEKTTRRAQFQLESRDFGETWTCARTNIGEVLASTPSLIYDSATGLVSNWYYERGRGILRRRVTKADDVSGHPLAWPESEAIALGGTNSWDAGNVNAVAVDGKQVAAWYSGLAPDTAIYSATI